MATTLHLCGVKTPCMTFSKGDTFFQRRQLPLHFGISGIPCVSGQCVLLKGSRGTVALQFTRVAGNADLIDGNDTENHDSKKIKKDLTCVMKFGGSSVASADRMREVANLILSFPEERPVIVLSAMGKTTSKLLLAGEKAVSYGVTKLSDIQELTFIKDLHLRTADDLEVERSIIAKHLFDLEQLLNGIAMIKEMTPRTMDYLVSFGECMSTRIFAAYLNRIGVKVRQMMA